MNYIYLLISLATILINLNLYDLLLLLLLFIASLILMIQIYYMIIMIKITLFLLIGYILRNCNEILPNFTLLANIFLLELHYSYLKQSKILMRVIVNILIIHQ
jgi:hypothetical protein